MLEKASTTMIANPQAIVVSQSRLKTLNVHVGQKIKLHGLNYPDMVFEFDIIGTLPEGKYEGVAFMNKDYLLTDAYKRKNRRSTSMQDKCVNLIWVRLPTKEAFERLSA